jgi:hypothetical protein
MQILRTTCVALMVCFLPTAVMAEEPAPECTKSQEISITQQLRRLSLDLRNRLPSYEEYLSVVGKDVIPAELIANWLTSNEYKTAMRRFHETLLWPNPAGAALLDQETRIRTTVLHADGGPDITVYHVASAGRKQTWRGDADTICGAWEQIEFDGTTPIPKPVVITKNGQPKTVQQDGYVTIYPYWDPEKPIKVCAFDAQVTESVMTETQGFNPLEQSCNDRRAFQIPECGCGPNLNYCFGPNVQGLIWADMREQFGKLVDNVTSGELDYTQLLLNPRIHMNSRLTFWKKYLAHMTTFNKTYNAYSPGDPDLPDEPDYVDNALNPGSTWTIETRTGLHSGILTLPAYMLRFQTDRGRANRFRTVFTNQYFIPPEQPESANETGCTEDTDDLTQKCTCRYCHQVLEPLAAHFGRFVEAGSVMLPDNVQDYRAQCDGTQYGIGMPYGNKPVPNGCNQFYVTDKSAKNPGWLLIYQFAYLESADPPHDNTGLDDPVHRAIGTNAATGPAALANSIISSEQFAASTVRNLFQYLMGREMILDPGANNDEIDLLKVLTRAFIDDYSYHFPSLVKRLVALDQYKRVR